MCASSVSGPRPYLPRRFRPHSGNSVFSPRHRYHKTSELTSNHSFVSCIQIPYSFAYWSFTSSAAVCSRLISMDFTLFFVSALTQRPNSSGIPVPEIHKDFLDSILIFSWVYSLAKHIFPCLAFLRTATSELQRRLLNAMPNRSSTHTIGVTWYLPSLLSLCIVFSFRTQYLRNHPLKS